MTRSILRIGALATTLLGVSMLSGCSMRPANLAPAQPAFDLRQYFDGSVQAWGQFQKRDGSVARRFRVDLVGTWQGTKGTLDEKFYYDDGSTEQRIWHLTDLGNGRFSGQAADVIGVAQGQAQGSAFTWRYTLRLPVGKTHYDVQFDDQMYRHDAQHMINRAVVRKFGIRVGEVTLFFKKPS